MLPQGPSINEVTEGDGTESDTNTDKLHEFDKGRGLKIQRFADVFYGCGFRGHT